MVKNGIRLIEQCSGKNGVKLVGDSKQYCWHVASLTSGQSAKSLGQDESKHIFILIIVTVIGYETMYYAWKHKLATISIKSHRLRGMCCMGDPKHRFGEYSVTRQMKGTRFSVLTSLFYVFCKLYCLSFEELSELKVLFPDYFSWIVLWLEPQ